MLKLILLYFNYLMLEKTKMRHTIWQFAWQLENPLLLLLLLRACYC